MGARISYLLAQIAMAVLLLAIVITLIAAH